MALPVVVVHVPGANTVFRSMDGLTFSGIPLGHTADFLWANERNAFLTELFTLRGTTVRRSIDGGDSFAVLAGALPATGQGPAFLKCTSGVLLAGIAPAGAVNGPRLARSTDAGLSWSIIDVELTGQDYAMSRGALYQLPSGRLICQSARQPNQDNNVTYSSDNDGSSWTFRAPFIAGSIGNIVWAPGDTAGFRTAFAGFADQRFYRTTDGAIWTQVFSFNGGGTNETMDANFPYARGIAKCWGTPGRYERITRTLQFQSLDGGITWGAVARTAPIMNSMGDHMGWPSAHPQQYWSSQIADFRMYRSDDCNVTWVGPGLPINTVDAGVIYTATGSIAGGSTGGLLRRRRGTQGLYPREFTIPMPGRVG